MYCKWLPFMCIVRVLREKVECCYISLPKEAQWNWLMLINDLWCQSFQGLFAYSQNSTASRKINICTSMKLSLLLSLRTYHIIAIQITMHVVQIAVTYAVCWLVWANSLTHLCLATFVLRCAANKQDDEPRKYLFHMHFPLPCTVHVHILWEG